MLYSNVKLRAIPNIFYHPVHRLVYGDVVVGVVCLQWITGVHAIRTAYAITDYPFTATGLTR
jgi:hypothetical protein